MAENDDNDSASNDEMSELDGIDESDAERLLAAAGDDQAGDAGDPSDSDGRDDQDALGDRGKRALSAVRRERDAARKELAEARSRLKQYEDANKSESQRLQEERDSNKTARERAEWELRRRDIADERAPEHATRAQIRAVAKRLAGDSDDELEADADELFALLAPAPPEPKKVAQRPKERLRGGGDPDEEPEESDPRKLADAIRRGGR